MKILIAEDDPNILAGLGDLPRERTAALSYLVRQDCGSCHGMTLKGGLGQSLRPAALK